MDLFRESKNFLQVIVDVSGFDATGIKSTEI